MYTGLIVNFEVLCNYCSGCEWVKETHKRHKNFDGLSGAVEAEIAVCLWSRSLQHNFRYVTFVGDGDSSAHSAVCKLNNGQGPYDVCVTKEECINHVHRRLGTRLRKMKNPNESLHFIHWQKIPKLKFSGIHRVKFVSGDHL